MCQFFITKEDKYDKETSIKIISPNFSLKDYNSESELSQIKRLIKEVKAVLRSGERRQLAEEGNQTIHQKIGDAGASERTASMIVERTIGEK